MNLLYFVGYIHFAVFETNGNERFLYSDGYRFHMNRQYIRKDCISWRCNGYKRYGCRARASTRMVNGYEMMKVHHGTHKHLPETTLEFGNRYT